MVTLQQRYTCFFTLNCFLHVETADRNLGMDIIKYCVAPTPKCPFSFLWSHAIQHLPRNWSRGPELGPRDISKLPRQRLGMTAQGNRPALDANGNWWPNISFPALTAIVLWASRTGCLPLSTNRASLELFHARHGAPQRHAAVSPGLVCGLQLLPHVG